MAASGLLLRTDYNVAWICPLPDVELLPARLMLDDEHSPPSIDTTYDDNTYICGTINGHRVVIAALPKGLTGNVNAGRLTGSMFKTFPNIKIALLVGIGGGVPRASRFNDPLEEVHLGDVVVGWPGDGKPAVVYHDLGRSKVDGEFEIVGTVDKPEWRLVQALSVLASNQEVGRATFADQLSKLRGRLKFAMPGSEHDRLFKASYHHVGEYGSNCASCDPSQLLQRAPRTDEQRKTLVFHQGRIATGNSVIQDGGLRDKISERCGGVLCVEMEAAGVDINGRCLVIRGISDYADSHKNDVWKHYAAGNAAAFARELLRTIQAGAVRDMEGTVQAPWLVPFERNQHFVGREVELQQLNSKLFSSETCQRAAIWGLGGCGKTAIALEFAYRTRQRHPRRAVYWVPAISQQSFERAYRDIGTLLQIRGIEDEKTDAKKLVQKALSNESSGEWLIVVDNADDVDVLFKQDADRARLIDYIPSSRKGSILFTTRTRKAAVDQAGGNAIQFLEMNQKEAKEVLEKSLVKKYLLEDDKIAEFLELLAYLPLAIVQAAAFINKNDISISGYLALFQGTAGDFIELLSEDFEDQGRYREMKNPVATTWIISFDQIRRQDPLAARYLSFMACILRENIPRSLLPHGSSTLEEAKAIGTLTAYAFVTKRQQQQKYESYDIHRLVHLATKNWLNMNNQWIFRINEAISQLADAIPYGDLATREIWTAYLPHAVYITGLSQSFDMGQMDYLLDRLGLCQYTIGQFTAAEGSFRRLFQMRETAFGKEHLYTMWSMNNLANALCSQGKHGEAETIHRKTLALREKVLGKEHPDTLRSMNYLANALYGQGKHGEAETIYRETLALREKVLGKEHPDMLTSMNNLAHALSNQGKHGEVERIHRETLALREKVLGKEHHNTLTSMNNLANTLYCQRKYGEAESMHRETLAQREKVLGKEHPDTMGSMNNLANALYGQRKYGEAESMHRETLAQREKVLGKEHPDTLASINNLAQVRDNLGSTAKRRRCNGTR